MVQMNDITGLNFDFVGNRSAEVGSQSNGMHWDWQQTFRIPCKVSTSTLVSIVSG